MMVSRWWCICWRIAIKSFIVGSSWDIYELLLGVIFFLSGRRRWWYRQSTLGNDTTSVEGRFEHRHVCDWLLGFKHAAKFRLDAVTWVLKFAKYINLCGCNRNDRRDEIARGLEVQRLVWGNRSKESDDEVWGKHVKDLWRTRRGVPSFVILQACRCRRSSNRD